MSLSPRLRAPFAAIDHVFGILVVPLAMLLAALLLRALGFTVAVIDTDEGLYLVQAQSWLRGHWPLVEVWDMHPVGAPAMFAAAMAVFGESIATIRLLGCICVALAGWAMNRDTGPRWNLGPRDNEPELSALTGRLRRAVDNHFQALTFFIIAVVMVQFTGSNGMLTAICAWIYLLARVLYVPAYAFGWSPGRSIIFGVGFLATMLMILTAIF